MIKGYAVEDIKELYKYFKVSYDHSAFDEWAVIKWRGFRNFVKASYRGVKASVISANVIQYK